MVDDGVKDVLAEGSDRIAVETRNFASLLPRIGVDIVAVALVGFRAGAKLLKRDVLHSEN